MNLLPVNTCLGKLSLFEVYSDFDGPKCFSVSNNLKQLFLVYWSNYDENTKSYEWLYSPISEKRLDDLRRQKEPISAVFKKPEQALYIANTGNDLSDDNCIWMEPSELDEISFPPDDFYIQPQEIEVINKSADWFYELKIAKSTEKHAFPHRTTVTSIFDCIGELIEDLMTESNQESPKVFPMRAVEGSFELKLGVSDFNKANKALIKLFNIFSKSSEIENKIQEYKLDPYKVKNLLDLVKGKRVNITLSPKLFLGIDEPIKITSKGVEDVIDTLENTTNLLIDSSLVPQANDIDKVIDIVIRRQKGETLLFENIEELTSKRQVKYYTDAAYCLGLLNKDLSVTSAGRFLSSQSNIESKYQVLADRFESSEFGWRWITWAGASSMADLEESTAVDFINTCISGLSEDTAKRRSSTLRKWLEVLKPYRREYFTPDNIID